MAKSKTKNKVQFRADLPTEFDETLRIFFEDNDFTLVRGTMAAFRLLQAVPEDLLKLVRAGKMQAVDNWFRLAKLANRPAPSKAAEKELLTILAAERQSLPSGEASNPKRKATQ